MDYCLIRVLLVLFDLNLCFVKAILYFKWRSHPYMDKCRFVYYQLKIKKSFGFSTNYSCYVCLMEMLALLLVILRFRRPESEMQCFDIQHSLARIRCHSRLLARLLDSFHNASFRLQRRYQLLQVLLLQ